MTTFSWRIFGSHTLLRLVPQEELDPLLDEEFALAPDEALLITEDSSLLEVVTTSTLNAGTGVQWLRKFQKKGGGFKVVFVSLPPVEMIVHLSLLSPLGIETRFALKLLYELVPTRVEALLNLLGEAAAVSTLDMEKSVAQRLTQVLDEELSAKSYDVEEADFEGLRRKVVESIKTLAPTLGIRINGFGLTWGIEQSRLEKMAAAAERRVEEIAVLQGECEEALFALTQSTAQEVEETVEESVAPTMEEPENLPEMEFDQSPEEVLEEVDQPLEEPVVEESPPQDMKEEQVSTSDSVDEEEYLFEAAAQDGEETEELTFTPPSDEVNAHPVEDWGANGEEVLVEEEPREEVEPEVEVEEEVGEEFPPRAVEWRVLGVDTVAHLLDEVEIPRLFRKDFSLFGEETALVIRSGQVEAVMTSTTEKTSGGLVWVSRLFGKGADVKVLFFSNLDRTLLIPVEGVDSTGEEVYGELSVTVRVTPPEAVRLVPLILSRGPLDVTELALALYGDVSAKFSEELSYVNGASRSLRSTEHGLNTVLRKACAAYGLTVVEAVFTWGGDREANNALEVLRQKRFKDQWRTETKRPVKLAVHRLNLANRRKEGLSALIRLTEDSEAGVRALLLRASLGPGALEEEWPDRALLEAELVKCRKEIEGLEEALREERVLAEASLKIGPPSADSISNFGGVTDEEESFLTDSLSDAAWEAEVYFGSGFGASRLAAAKPGESHPPQNGGYSHGAASPSALKGLDPHQEEGGEHLPLKLGVGGGMVTNINRCPFCMAPFRRNLDTCGNCGRKVLAPS